jgi:hypothetical protein
MGADGQFDSNLASGSRPFKLEKRATRSEPR